MNEQEKWAERVLASVQEVEKQDPPSESYDKILATIRNRRSELVSMTWVRAAAAVLICLITIELVLSRSADTEATELTELIPENNNTLYYE